MKKWRAIMPLKPADERKERLSLSLAPAERIALSECMADHVLSVLAGAPGIASVAVLSARPYKSWNVIADGGRGLNPELADVRRNWQNDPILIIHADLPEVTTDDIGKLLAAASGDKVAIAPDRHRSGTNAVAIPANRNFDFAFGPQSFRRHLAACPDASVVLTPGLSRDIDTEADFAEWTSRRDGAEKLIRSR